MTEQTAGVKEELAETRQRLLETARALDREDWTQPVYVHDEQEWSAADLLRHLTWAESGMLMLMKQIQRGESGTPPDFDLDRYNARGVSKLKDKMPAELLEQLQENRRQLLAFLDTLAEADWDETGRHGSGNIMSIREIAQTIAHHEAEHLQDLRQALDPIGR